MVIIIIIIVVTFPRGRKGRALPQGSPWFRILVRTDGASVCLVYSRHTGLRSPLLPCARTAQAVRLWREQDHLVRPASQQACPAVSGERGHCSVQKQWVLWLSLYL